MKKTSKKLSDDILKSIIYTRSSVFRPAPKIPNLMNYRGANDQPKSLITSESYTTKPESTVYTGDSVLGIATMHKSNAVPIFSTKEAIEVSSMRRN